MKTSKYIFSILLLVTGFAITVQGQDTIINRNISVEREYRPVINDAGKIKSMPQVLEPNVEKTPAVYSNFNLPLNAGYNIHTLPAADLVIDKPVNANNGYARFGLGNYMNTLADFAYPVVNTPDMRFDFSLNHLATFEAKRMHTTTKANLAFDKLFDTFDLYAGAGVGHEAFNYYGSYLNGADSAVNLNTFLSKYSSQSYMPLYRETNRAGIIPNTRLYNLKTLSNDSTGDTFWRFNALAGVRSLASSTGLRYQAEIQFQAFSSINGLTENLVHSLAKFNSPGKKNRLGLDFDMYNMMYSSTAIPDFNFWKNYTVMTLNPYYSIESTSFNVRLGLKTSLSFVHGRFINPSADVRAEWKAVPKILSVYGGLTGDYEVNTQNKSFSENPYLFSDMRIYDTNTPLDFYVGIKLKPLYNLLLDAYIDHKQIDNQYFYVNKGYSLTNRTVAMPASDSVVYSNRFNVVYSAASLFKMGIRANYNLQDIVNLEFKWAYNVWTVDNQQYAWNMPKYEAQLNADVRINQNFTISANMFYEGDRFAKLGYTAIAMHDKVDINLGVNYSYTKWLTVFGKINNLINNKYQNYYGYDVQGTNMMVGAAFSF